MTERDVMEIARNALIVTLKLSMPVLLAGLVVGVFISIMQAITQIQEFTLSFVPKLLAVLLTLALLGPWMLTTLIGFLNQTFLQLPNITR
jgi:flagellar biosynthetic protein FliQ